MKYLSALFLVFLSFSLSSQATSGSLTMEITDISSPMENAQMTELMKGMEMETHFTPENQVTVINMDMMGMKMTMRQYYEGNVMTQFIDMMGQKMKTKIDMSDMDAAGYDLAMMKDAYNVTFDKTNTQEILGFQCYKAIITMDVEKMTAEKEIPQGMREMQVICYITDDIKMNHFAVEQLKGMELPGTPLKMEMDMGIMSMTYQATSFSKGVDASIFEYPEGDYKEMDAGAFKGLGGSFGF